MSLKQRIQEDIKSAMKAREQSRLGVLRMLSAAIKQREVDGRVELTDAQILEVLEKQIKQRKEAAVQFEQGGRTESAQAELAEIDVLKKYLPAQMSEGELSALIKQVIETTGAAGPSDMGKVMGAVKPQVVGRADMGLVSKLIKGALSAMPGGS